MQERAMFETIPYEAKNIEVDDQHVAHEIYLYGLSYCGHCQEGQAFLEELGVPFKMALIDTLEADVRRPALKRFRDIYGKHVPYPVLEVDGEYLFGFDREAWEQHLS
jgi:glutaredoxin